MSLGRRGALWGAAGLLAAGRARAEGLADPADPPGRPLRAGGASDLLPGCWRSGWRRRWGSR